ncbi:MAG: hypothetical protein ACP6IP_00395 [Candidatus Njordarchaeia archaeon]
MIDEILEKVEKYLNRAEVLSDLLPLIDLSDKILQRALEVEEIEEWAKQYVIDMLGDMAKKILAIREKLSE